jgi:hypothetical protein
LYLLIAVPLKVVDPDTSSELDNVVIPDTFNELLVVEILFNVVDPHTFHELFIVVVVFNVVVPDT